jgi:hypothetical protein
VFESRQGKRFYGDHSNALDLGNMHFCVLKQRNKEICPRMFLKERKKLSSSI